MPKARGRPPREFDLKQVEAFGKLGLTGMEMAALLGTTNVTISHRMTDEESEFFKAYQLGFSDLKKSLRRAQIRSALRGCAALLIWLGKQHLDQHEQPMLTVSATAVANAPAPVPSPAEMRARLVAAREFLEQHRDDFQKPTNSRFDVNGD